MTGLTTIILFLICVNAFSCDCSDSHFDSDVANSSYIFSGLIISKENTINKVQDNTFHRSVKYRVVVKANWKGELKDTIDLYSGYGGGDCGFVFEVNQSYMIWANSGEFGPLSTSRCGRTGLLNDSPDIDLLNNKFKGLAYDSTYLMSNEIKVLKKQIKNDTIDLSKTALFIGGDKLISKKELIDALLNQRPIIFHLFPSDKLKLLPDKAINGILIVKDFENQKIPMKKIINTIKKSQLQL